MAQTDFRTALQGANEIEITVTGRTSGRSLSYPVWFALEGEKLYLLPVRGSDTDWYKNLRKTPTIRDHPPGGPWEDVHHERPSSHRRGADRQGP